MADSWERRGQIMLKVFEILMPHAEGLPAREALARAASEMKLTEYEKSDYPHRPGVRRFEKVARFSTIGPVKAGWMTKNHGQWTLTEEGRKAFAKYKDPSKFMEEAGRLYRVWASGQPTDAEEERGGTPASEVALEEAEETAWAEVEGHLLKLNPYDFQDMVGGLLKAMGYHVSWTAPAGPDKGIDIIAYRDPLGIEGGRIKVQVKRRADKIAVGEVRSFLALLGENDVGLFVAIGGFTPDAESETRGQERRRLVLLDAKKFFDLWLEHYEQIPEKERRLLPLRAVYFLAPPKD